MLSVFAECSTVSAVAKRRAPEKMVQVNIRLPEKLQGRLEAASGAFGKSREQIVADALMAWLDGLPGHDRQLIDAVAARRQKS
jgi:predicted DNA-binding protein